MRFSLDAVSRTAKGTMIMNQMKKELMRLQGVLRMAFMSRGIDEEKALELSGEALHIFVTSDISKDEYRAEYEKTLIE